MQSVSHLKQVKQRRSIQSTPLSPKEKSNIAEIPAKKRILTQPQTPQNEILHGNPNSAFQKVTLSKKMNSRSNSVPTFLISNDISADRDKGSLVKQIQDAQMQVKTLQLLQARQANKTKE